MGLKVVELLARSARVSQLALRPNARHVDETADATARGHAQFTD